MHLINLSSFREVLYYHLYVVRSPARDKVQAELSAAGIATGIHYPIALPNLQAYKYMGKLPADFPTASKYSQEILSLPIFPEIEESQIEYICNQLIKAVNHI